MPWTISSACPCIGGWTLAASRHAANAIAMDTILYMHANIPNTSHIRKRNGKKIKPVLTRGLDGKICKC